MYHYLESGLRNVWLVNGFTERDTPYGRTISITNTDELHRAIGKAIASKARLTGGELRFLRKELGLSQKSLAACIGSSEQNVSLWERRGRLPATADRLVRLLYLESTDGNVQVRKLLDRLNDLDNAERAPLHLRSARGHWRLAA